MIIPPENGFCIGWWALWGRITSFRDWFDPGKSTWVKHELQGRRLTHTSVSLNEHTSELQLITQLQSCCRWRRGAIVLCISPLVQALWVDVVVFRQLGLQEVKPTTPFVRFVGFQHLSIRKKACSDDRWVDVRAESFIVVMAPCAARGHDF